MYSSMRSLKYGLRQSAISHKNKLKRRNFDKRSKPTGPLRIIKSTKVRSNAQTNYCAVKKKSRVLI